MIDSTTAADSTQQTDDGADGGDDSSGSADKPPAAPPAPSPRVRATATAAPPVHQPSPHKTTNGVLKRMFGSNADSNTPPAAAPPNTAAAAMLLATAQHPPSIATVNGIHGVLGVGGGPASTTTPGLASRSRSSSSSSPSSPSPYVSDASRPPSRAPSASGGRGGIGRVPTPASVAVEPPSGRRSRASSAAGDDGLLMPGAGYNGPYLSPNDPPKRPPSIASVASSATGESHKFKLSDLLSSGPKLARKASASSRKSASAKSDSERGGGSVIESTGSLKKYGVCERMAIGKGATSVVKLAHKWDRTEEKLYAVKEFRKRRKNETEKEYVKKLTSEFCISSTLHHINVVETVDLVQDDNQHWCEVMEYCPGGDLYAAIKKGGMSGSEIECCFKQILNGLGYLHSQGVAHRDIKPENLFFDTRGHLKIGDFGASTVYRLPWEATVHMSSGLCGSEPYIAPEQFSSKLYDARLVDIWACGVVYYCLQFQELPWRVAQPSDTLFSTYRQQCTSPAFSIAPSHQPPQQHGESARAAAEREKNTTYPTTIMNLPRASRATLRRMLEPDPRHRCTIETVLKMPWIQGIETCTDPNVVPKHVHACARGATGSST